MEDVAGFKRQFNSNDICIEPLASDAEKTDDIRCDIELSVIECKKAQMTVIETINKIRKVDVPWKIYLGMWIAILIFVAVISYLFLAVFRLSPKVSVPIAVGLFVGATLALMLITYCGFKEEEIVDAQKLADLYNTVKEERVH